MSYYQSNYYYSYFIKKFFFNAYIYKKPKHIPELLSLDFNLTFHDIETYDDLHLYEGAVVLENITGHAVRIVNVLPIRKGTIFVFKITLGSLINSKFGYMFLSGFKLLNDLALYVRGDDSLRIMHPSQNEFAFLIYDLKIFDFSFQLVTKQPPLKLIFKFKNGITMMEKQLFSMVYGFYIDVS